MSIEESKAIGITFFWGGNKKEKKKEEKKKSEEKIGGITEQLRGDK